MSASLYYDAQRVFAQRTVGVRRRKQIQVVILQKNDYGKKKGGKEKQEAPRIVIS